MAEQEQNETILEVAAKRGLWVCVKDFLFGTKVPVWFIIISAIVAAGGTYWLAPKIDKLNEKNRVYSELLLDRLASLNDTTRSLLSNLAIIHEQKRINVEPSAELKLQLASQFTELQMRSIELRSLLNDGEKSSQLLSYQKALRDLKIAHNNANSPEELEEALQKVRAFAEQSVMLGDQVLEDSIR